MEQNKNTFLDLFSMLGYFIGFGLILYYSIFNKTNHWLLLIGIVIILGFRLLGFAFDKIANKNK